MSHEDQNNFERSIKRIEYDLQALKDCIKAISAKQESVLHITDGSPLSAAHYVLFLLDGSLASLEGERCTTYEVREIVQEKDRLKNQLEEVEKNTFTEQERFSLLARDLQESINLYEHYVVKPFDSTPEEFGNVLSLRDRIEAILYSFPEKINITNYWERVKALDDLLCKNANLSWLDRFSQEMQVQTLKPITWWWWYRDGYTDRNRKMAFPEI
jgi:hypothetical protein